MKFSIILPNTEFRCLMKTAYDKGYNAGYKDGYKKGYDMGGQLKMDNYNFAQQGWQCPICKRVYSPFTPCCFTCGAEGITKTSTGTGKPYEEPNYTTISTGYATYTAEDKGVN